MASVPRKAKRVVKKPKLGTGERFRSVKAEAAKNPKVRDPEAVAAAAGRKRWGKKKMAQLAAKGRKRKNS